MFSSVNTFQGWAVLAFIAFLNVIGLIIFFKPNKLISLYQIPAKLMKNFGLAWLLICIWIDLLLLAVTLRGEFPFN